MCKQTLHKRKLYQLWLGHLNFSGMEAGWLDVFQVFSPQNLHTWPCSNPLHSTCTFVILTTPTHQGAFNSYGSLLAIAEKKASLPEMEPLPGERTVFSVHLCKGGGKWPTQLQPSAFKAMQAQKRPCYLGRVQKPTQLPCPGLSAGTEPKSQGHCRKCDITDECLMPSVDGFVVNIIHRLLTSWNNSCWIVCVKFAAICGSKTAFV